MSLLAQAGQRLKFRGVLSLELGCGLPLGWGPGICTFNAQEECSPEVGPRSHVGNAATRTVVMRDQLGCSCQGEL